MKTQEKLNNEKLHMFIKERGFTKFHTFENLAKALSIEANELLRNYLWGQEWPHLLQPDIENVKEELADIMIFLMIFCNKLGVNIHELVKDKIIKNEIKYKCTN